MEFTALFEKALTNKLKKILYIVDYRKCLPHKYSIYNKHRQFRKVYSLLCTVACVIYIHKTAYCGGGGVGIKFLVTKYCFSYIFW